MRSMPQAGGSPPHARGGGYVNGKHGVKVRITPARAGRSFLPLPSGKVPQDHPRTRGEESGSCG